MQMQNFTIWNVYFLLKIGDVPVCQGFVLGGLQFGRRPRGFVSPVIRLRRRNQPTGCIQSTRSGENAAVPVNPWARHQLPGTPRPIIYKWLFQLDDEQNLYIEHDCFTISIHLYMVGLGVPGTGKSVGWFGARYIPPKNPNPFHKGSPNCPNQDPNHELTIS